MPKLGPFLATLDAWLEAEEKLPARERRTAQRLYEGLFLEGYTGAVDGVRRYMRSFDRRRHADPTVFTRAFARLTGHTPSEFRASLSQ
jgi:hypothetical protein